MVARSGASPEKARRLAAWQPDHPTARPPADQRRPMLIWRESNQILQLRRPETEIIPRTLALRPILAARAQLLIGIQFKLRAAQVDSGDSFGLERPLSRQANCARPSARPLARPRAPALPIDAHKRREGNLKIVSILADWS